MTKEIRLTQGRVALVDDEDYEYLVQWKWCVRGKRGKWYALRNLENRRQILMHREILSAEDSEQVDHINGDGLDNRRENLRTCNNSENLRNRGKTKINSSGFKGVTLHHGGKWQAYIRSGYQAKYLGLFKTPVEAARAYDRAAVECHGQFARLNMTCS